MTLIVSQLPACLTDKSPELKDAETIILVTQKTINRLYQIDSLILFGYGMNSDKVGYLQKPYSPEPNDKYLGAPLVLELSSIESLVRIILGFEQVLILTKDSCLFNLFLNEKFNPDDQLVDWSRGAEFVNVRKVLIPTGVGRVTAVRWGSEHNMALTDAGRILVWGSNFDGQLGIGHHRRMLTNPQLVDELEHVWVVHIAAGAKHSLAVTEDGKIWTWGSNRFGQLGIGNYDSQDFPVEVKIPDEDKFVAVAGGRWHSLFLSESGNVYSCGKNSFRELGIVSHSGRKSKPVKIPSLEGMKAIAAYLNMSFAMNGDGQCYIWGRYFRKAIEHQGEIVISLPEETPYRSVSLAMFSNCFNPVTPQPAFINNFLKPIQQKLAPDSIQLNQEEGSDLQFMVDGHKIYAHRDYLQSASEYMNRMLSGPWFHGDDSIIIIEDFSYPVFFAYLQFLYTGEFEVNFDQLIQLYCLSHRFMEYCLTSRCFPILRSQISVTNCCDLYELCSRLEHCHILKWFVEFAIQNGQEVFESEGYRAMDNQVRQSFDMRVKTMRIQMQASYHSDSDSY